MVSGDGFPIVLCAVQCYCIPTVAFPQLLLMF